MQFLLKIKNAVYEEGEGIVKKCDEFKKIKNLSFEGVGN